jgi:hypothetical protein
MHHSKEAALLLLGLSFLLVLEMPRARRTTTTTTESLEEDSLEPATTELNFRPLQGYAVVPNAFIRETRSPDTDDRDECFAQCDASPKCDLLTFSDSTCTFYKTKLYRFLARADSSASVVWQKARAGSFPRVYAWSVPYDPSLASYWPIVAGSGEDLVAGRDLECAGTPILAKDRLGNVNGAVRVMNSLSPASYYTAPDAVYFSGDFSFIAWVKVYSCLAWSRVGIINLYLSMIKKN